MHAQHHASRGERTRRARDAVYGASAAPVARAPDARQCAARAVQVVELEVPAVGRGASEGRPAAAARWQRQPRVSASPGHSRRPRRRWRGRRPARARGSRRGVSLLFRQLHRIPASASAEIRAGCRCYHFRFQHSRSKRQHMCSVEECEVRAQGSNTVGVAQTSLRDRSRNRSRPDRP